MSGWSRALSGFKATPKAGETYSGNRGLQIEEKLIFEQDAVGRCGVDLPEPPKHAHRAEELRDRQRSLSPGLVHDEAQPQA
jgi:glycine dehydrogenase subunit 2